MTPPSPTPPPQPRRRPRRIRPLPREVVDRIAAGEVVQRPVSVVKELVENSLDADATHIDVQCQRGGLDSIVVTDDGAGMAPRDLPLACTRHATSKLVDADDLRSIRTFGFRGEALASASMVARVTITSRVRPRPKNGPDANDDESSDDDEKRPGNCAFKMAYHDGAPDPKSHPNSKPKPSAGREGTAISVQDLFYNIPSRRRAMEGSKRSERDEYDRILGVVQRYAVHEAGRGVGFLCRGSGGGGGKGKKGFGGASNRTDLNTQSLASVKKLQDRRKRARTSSANPQPQLSTEEERSAATKDAIGHVFGTAVARELLPLQSGEGDVEAVSVAALKAMTQQKGELASDGLNEVMGKDKGESDEKKEEFANSLLEEMMMGGQTGSDAPSSSNNDNSKSGTQQSSSKFAFAYRAAGMITNGSYSAPKASAAFLLFINGRLVESPSLRRAVESVYSDTLPKGGRPFVYLSLELPGPHVDVNVHPTKREVALLHEDRLCDAVARAVREAIGGATTSRTFSVATGGRLLPKEEGWGEGGARTKLTHAAMTGALTQGEKDEAPLESSRLGGKENAENGLEPALKDNGGKASSLAANHDQQAGNAKGDAPKSDSKTPKKRSAEAVANKTTTAKKKPYDPSRLVRTSRSLPVGALEPFLVQKEAKAGEKGEGSEGAASQSTEPAAIKHKPGCPLANSASPVDMSQPGAFATAICRCQVERSETLPPAPNAVVVRKDASAKVVRPKKIAPTQCEYESITNLREEIANLNHQGTNEMLRESIYVGAVTRSRSLIQSGIDLFMINHRALANEMFYQIALLKFSGMPMAELGRGGVDVMAAIGQVLQHEEDLNSSSSTDEGKISKTNLELARQATACLAEKASMLLEYFSVRLERVEVYGDGLKKQKVTSLRVTGLPILLEGHVPEPHGLPLFLLRLATEVNWMEEQPCFEGVCRELAAYYAELPFPPADESDDSLHAEAKKRLQHTLFPAISFLLVPPGRLKDSGAVVKLANLTSLYRVFERC
ncbi:hypothetical protein ACHAXT_011150 [Thalassiosira profunda]